LFDFVRAMDSPSHKFLSSKKFCWAPAHLFFLLKKFGSAVSTHTKALPVLFRPRKKPLESGFLRGLVDDIRTGFERRNDATVYIPTFYSTLETTI
jgi:hypothetical protein